MADETGCHPVHATATPRMVATVRDERGVDFDAFCRRVRWDAEHRGAVGVFLFVELALRSFRTSIREVRSTLDDLEESMLDAAHRAHLLTLHGLHRRISLMRRALGEYADAVADINDVFETPVAGVSTSVTGHQPADRDLGLAAAVDVRHRVLRNELRLARRRAACR